MTNAVVNLLKISERFPPTPCRHCSSDPGRNRHPQHYQHNNNNAAAASPLSRISAWCDGGEQLAHGATQKPTQQQQQLQQNASIKRLTQRSHCTLVDRAKDDARKHFTDPSAPFKHYDDLSRSAEMGRGVKEVITYPVHLPCSCIYPMSFVEIIT